MNSCPLIGEFFIFSFPRFWSSLFISEPQIMLLSQFLFATLSIVFFWTLEKFHYFLHLNIQIFFKSFLVLSFCEDGNHGVFLQKTCRSEFWICCWARVVAICVFSGQSGDTIFSTILIEHPIHNHKIPKFRWLTTERKIISLMKNVLLVKICFYFRE